MRAFVWREVFFTTYMPRQKTIRIFFAVATAKLYEVFYKLRGTALPSLF